MAKIFIAIPSASGNIRADLTTSLLYWYLHSDGHRLNAPPLILQGKFPMDNARNQIVKAFLESDFDYLWWIDDDVVPPPYAMKKLIDTIESRPDIDAIGATCFSMRGENGQYYPYPVTLKTSGVNQYKIYYGSGIEEVDATGGGCLMVSKKVYESIGKRPYEFLYDENGIMNLTCDFLIWQKAKAKGFRLWVDFDLMCDHQRLCSIKSFQDHLALVSNV